MSITNAVSTALSEWPSLFEEDGQAHVPTHCLYPSNSSVTVQPAVALDR